MGTKRWVGGSFFVVVVVVVGMGMLSFVPFVRLFVYLFVVSYFSSARLFLLPITHYIKKAVQTFSYSPQRKQCVCRCKMKEDRLMDASGPGVGAQRRPGAATNATRFNLTLNYIARGGHIPCVSTGPACRYPPHTGHGPTNGQREPSSPYFGKK